MILGKSKLSSGSLIEVIGNQNLKEDEKKPHSQYSQERSFEIILSE
jgi:hypothetical protein